MTDRAPALLARRSLFAAAAAALGAGRARAQAPAPQDPWPELAQQIFADRTLRDGSQLLAIEAPYRAEDAALVPIVLRSLLPPGDARSIRAITLVIDQNPSPLAAVFTPGPASGMRLLSTRVRVDSYTNIHAVAELSDGELYATQQFVKAAGGCSAPAANVAADGIPPGTMRFRRFASADPDRAEAEFAIRHPNNSGMQMDQVTRLYVPAHFVKSVRLMQGQDLLLSVESGISIAENPTFRFDFRANGAISISADAEDNEGTSFHQSWAATQT
ncbi:MAG TPA: quinoprotein dehydrogenase-associated SoxYZ-like carrier [Acetobacteraceae bacterium]|nr:quinoprotein dehydrogenase-associated SoxYZ-like carrier [Acetobacteraceae bacterium]